MWGDLGLGVSLGLDIAAEYVNSRSDLMVKVCFRSQSIVCLVSIQITICQSLAICSVLEGCQGISSINFITRIRVEEVYSNLKMNMK
jgi:hypothetical protein